MSYAASMKLAVVAVAVGVLLTLALPFFETQRVQATPAIAKGRPCTTCHSGSPPSKKNLKKR